MQLLSLENLSASQGNDQLLRFGKRKKQLTLLSSKNNGDRQRA